MHATSLQKNEIIYIKKARQFARLNLFVTSIIYFRPRAIFARETSPSLSMKYNQPDSR
jgi:hypothetical protein